MARIDPSLRAARLFSAVLCASALIVFGCYELAGNKAATGMACGIFGSILNIWGLRGIINLAGLNRTEKGFRFGSFLIVLVFFMKLPVFVLLAKYTQSVGQPATAYFLGGIGLVYFALVGWSIAQR